MQTSNRHRTRSSQEFLLDVALRLPGQSYRHSTPSSQPFLLVVALRLPGWSYRHGTRSSEPFLLDIALRLPDQSYRHGKRSSQPILLDIALRLFGQRCCFNCNATKNFAWKFSVIMVFCRFARKGGWTTDFRIPLTPFCPLCTKSAALYARRR